MNPQKLLSPPSVRSDHQRSNDDDKISDIVVLSEVSANETHSLKSNELVEEDFEIACRKSPSPPQELSQGGAGPIDLTTLDSEETSNIKRNVYFESSSAEDRKSKKRVHKISLNAEFDHCNSNDETVVSKRIRNATRLHV